MKHRAPQTLPKFCTAERRRVKELLKTQNPAKGGENSQSSLANFLHTETIINQFSSLSRRKLLQFSTQTRLKLKHEPCMNNTEKANAEIRLGQQRKQILLLPAIYYN